MKVIAGLGNPGAAYVNTPHSIGFEAVDALASDINASWKRSSSFKGELASGFVGNVKVMLVKPQTFMNLSGDSVAPVLKYHNCTSCDLIVVSDDIDLPAGKIRIRRGGSAGGHNGLKSVIERVGTQDFVRVRVGVGREGRNRSSVISHVLGKFSPADRVIMDEVVVKTKEVLESLVTGNVEISMNRYNGWTAPAAESSLGKEKDK